MACKHSHNTPNTSGYPIKTCSEEVETEPNLGPVSPDSVIADIESALKLYLGSEHTVTAPCTVDMFSESENCKIVCMQSLPTEHEVVPDLTGTRLMYKTDLIPLIAPIFMCTQNGTNNTQFLYAWNIRGVDRKWYIGSPNLFGQVTSGNPVTFTSKEITSDLRESNRVEAIENTLGNMPGRTQPPTTGFKDSRYVWTRNEANDNNFKVSKTDLDGKEWYWAAKAEGTGENPSVTVTCNNEAFEGVFKCTVIS